MPPLNLEQIWSHLDLTNNQFSHDAARKLSVSFQRHTLCQTCFFLQGCIAQWVPRKKMSEKILCDNARCRIQCEADLTTLTAKKKKCLHFISPLIKMNTMAMSEKRTGFKTPEAPQKPLKKTSISWTRAGAYTNISLKRETRDPEYNRISRCQFYREWNRIFYQWRPRSRGPCARRR